MITGSKLIEIRARRTALTSLAIISAFWSSTGHPQGREFRGCELTDERCLGDAYYAACSSRLADWTEGCRELLGDLEARISAREPELLSLAGLIHQQFARASSSAADNHTATAASLYLEAITIDPSYRDAYLGLATIAESNEDRIRWLRGAVRARDANSMTLESLATVLERRGTLEDRLEAVALRREAYDSVPPSRFKWVLATEVLYRYERLERETETLEFLRAVRADIGIEALMDALGSAESSTDAAIDALAMLCQYEVVSMLGAEQCLSGAELVFAAALRARDRTIGNRLIKAGAEATDAVPTGAAVPTGWPGTAIGWFERLLAADYESWELLRSLGRCYLRIERKAEALYVLERAQTLAIDAADTPLNANQKLQLEFDVGLARNASPDPQRERNLCPGRSVIVR